MASMDQVRNVPLDCKQIFQYEYMHSLSNLIGNGLRDRTSNTKGGSITVPLTSRLTGLKSAVW